MCNDQDSVFHFSNLRYNLIYQYAELRYGMDMSGFLEDEKTEVCMEYLHKRKDYDSWFL